tara:strand:- start:4 stop:660 length:657 start_codon:yes stop_codon:yes gene_type:complete
MGILIRYTLFIILAIGLYSCGSNSYDISKEDSSIIFYNKNSKLKCKQITFDNSGHITSIQTFKNDKLDTDWVPDNSDLTDMIEYYGNGQIKVKGYFKNGLKHSLWSYFDRSGHLLIERYFSYGKPSNIWIWYDHHNHDIDYYQIYEDNRDDGYFTRYYQSSNLKEQKEYTNQKLNGNYMLFYDNTNNSIQLSGQYIHGAKSGNWSMFNSDGIFLKFFE